MAKIIKKEEASLLWSDESGDLRKKKDSNKPVDIIPSEYTLKIQLEKNKRGGKTVSVIMDIPFNPKYFQKLTKDLKKICGTGGSYKETCIEIQGDHRETIKAKLIELGFKSKLTGG
jgi:translation initiation factor 1